MLAIFSLRLATGMLAALLLLSPAQVNPRFFRTHFLTALALAALATAFLFDVADLWLCILLAGLMMLTALASMAWMLEAAPGGRALIWAAVPLAILALLKASTLAAGTLAVPPQAPWWLVADDLTSAAVLGSAMTAMLIGHSYLIAPLMSLTPMYRLLGALAATTILRVGITMLGLWLWPETTASTTLNNETSLWLAVRWVIGFVGPLVLCWLAWETARIRSTQSATGILYVVVILCFLGELTSQILLSQHS